MKLSWDEIKRIITNSATVEEQERFSLWLNEEQENREYFEKMKAYYSDPLTAQHKNEIQRPFSNARHILGERQKKSFMRLYIASGVSVAALLILFFTFPTVDSTKEIIVENTTPKNEITLVAEDGKMYTIESATTVKNAQVSGERIIYNNIEKDVVEYHTIKVPHKKDFIITLSDGTTVHLNAMSELRYPTTFPEGEERKVYLKGEAYFDVTKNDKDKFTVAIDDVNVTVYGTKFNVNSYNTTIETVLIEGSVAVNGTMIVPNQKAIVNRNDGTILVENVKAQKYISWSEGYFTFENERIVDIVPILSRWYGVEIDIENEKTKQLRVNCYVPKYETIDTLLNILTETDRLKYRTADGKYIIR